MRTVSIGAQDFEELRMKNCLYIDKTAFIREWWDSKDKVTLITRPRRFGKTLNMSMLECFFSNRYRGRSELFEGLKIWDYPDYRSLQGTWPVIFLTFADIRDISFDRSVMKIRYILSTLYRQNSQLLNGDILSEIEKRQFLAFSEPDMSGNEPVFALRTLTEYLYRMYEKKVILLLDEYDTPMQEAWVNGYWPEMSELMRDLLSATFKTNPFLERGLMTGITRISKESIFSGLNNLKTVTITANEYATAFGFTEKEVFEALAEQGMSDREQEVKQWYDGFTIGQVTDLYNPWSVTNFLDTGRTDTYWANSSDNTLVSKLIKEGKAEIKTAMEDLLKGKALKCEIDEQTVFNQLEEDENAVWSLLLTSGYLRTIAREDSDYTLALTNLEVSKMFIKLIKKWFGSERTEYNAFLRALLQGNTEDMNSYMNLVSERLFSSFDTGTQPSRRSQPERFYHGFVLGLMAEWKDRYLISSNRESGFGRYDVMLEPLNQTDPAFILEFKVLQPEKEKSLEDTANAALRQIEEKKYALALTQRGIEKARIRCYGFAFQGKRVLIK